MEKSHVRPEKTRVAIIGAGYIADFHMLGLRSVPNARVVAVCDPHIARARNFAARYRIPKVYSDVDDLLKCEQIDAAHVLVPAQAHFECAHQILKSNIDIFLEKPICVSLSQCNKLLVSSNVGQKNVGVSHNFLFSDIYEQLKKDVSENSLGRIDEIVVVWNKELHQLQTGPHDSWLFNSPGNIMMEVGSHCFAHVLDLVGEPKDLHVDITDKVDLPNGLHFYRRWRILGSIRKTSIQVRFSFRPGYAQHAIHVRGSLASATVDFERDLYIRRRHFALSIDFDRFWATTSESWNAFGQATSTLGSYIVSKLGLSKKENPYKNSIRKSVIAFHRVRAGHVEPRICGKFGKHVVALAERVVALSGIRNNFEKLGSNKFKVKRTKPATVLVIGGTGCIGRALVKKLVATGYAVRVFSRSSRVLPEFDKLPLELFQGDIIDPKAVEEALKGIEFVYQLARSYGPSWQQYFEEEVCATERLAEACLRNGVERLIYSSSIAIFYAGARARLVTEETPSHRGTLRNNVYARAKAETERVLKRLYKEKALPVVVVRPGIVIGEGCTPLHGGVCTWHFGSVCEFVGNGKNALPFVLLKDVVTALISCLNAPNIVGESLNLVGQQMLSAEDYLRELEQVTQLKFERVARSPQKLFLDDLCKTVAKVVIAHPEKNMPSYRGWEGRTSSAKYDCRKTQRLLQWQPENDRDELIRVGIQIPAKQFFD